MMGFLLQRTCPADRDRVNITRLRENVYKSDALVLQSMKRPRQFKPLPTDNMNGKIAVSPCGMAFHHNVLRQIKDDCHAVDVMRPCNRNKFSSRRRLNVRRIHYRQSAELQPFLDDGVQEFERIPGDCLVGFVIRENRTAAVR
ncbi:hypothetical protein PTE30175_02528 [Pandoraea terrae]|uniref:Uncharacterized protein n=1 Tax=Pandoraea terrae TaxID=1537710 RepID=A0A5E4VDI9_9BURK|nr:hypothetical protein PTE30175_02528 [Pandoraea terrae]